MDALFIEPDCLPTCEDLGHVVVLPLVVKLRREEAVGWAGSGKFGDMRKGKPMTHRSAAGEGEIPRIEG